MASQWARFASDKSAARKAIASRLGSSIDETGSLCLTPLESLEGTLPRGQLVFAGLDLLLAEGKLIPSRGTSEVPGPHGLLMRLSLAKEFLGTRISGR